MPLNKRNQTSQVEILSIQKKSSHFYKKIFYNNIYYSDIRLLLTRKFCCYFMMVTEYYIQLWLNLPQVITQRALLCLYLHYKHVICSMSVASAAAAALISRETSNHWAGSHQVHILVSEVSSTIKVY